jgi:hypothetical protein
MSPEVARSRKSVPGPATFAIGEAADEKKRYINPMSDHTNRDRCRLSWLLLPVLRDELPMGGHLKSDALDEVDGASQDIKVP